MKSSEKKFWRPVVQELSTDVTMLNKPNHILKMGKMVNLVMVIALQCKKVFNFIVLFWVSACAYVNTHVTAHVWVSEDSSVESILSY